MTTTWDTVLKSRSIRNAWSAWSRHLFLEPSIWLWYIQTSKTGVEILCLLFKMCTRNKANVFSKEANLSCKHKKTLLLLVTSLKEWCLVFQLNETNTACRLTWKGQLEGCKAAPEHRERLESLTTEVETEAGVQPWVPSSGPLRPGKMKPGEEL